MLKDDDFLTRLPSLVRLDHMTGRLFWLPRDASQFATSRSAATWNARFAGREALNTARPDGYLGGTICYRKTLAHRVVWALVHGEWPTGDIDHINHNGFDNRPENLRHVSHVANAQNQRRRRNNTSGVLGVTAFRGKWQAYVNVGGRKRNLGTFSSLEDAANARRKADLAFGFHPNHGLAA